MESGEPQLGNWDCEGESETAHFIGIWDGSENSPHKHKKKREAQLNLPLIYCSKPAKQTAITPIKNPVCYSKNPQFADAPFPL